MIGEQKLTDYLTNWMQKHDFDCEAMLGSDFEYCIEDDVVIYALVVPQKHDELFQKLAFDLGLRYTCDNFLLSFFHEIGHYETYYLLEDSEISYCEDVKRELYEHKTFSMKDYWTYYNLPDEVIATQWAVDFINEHPTEIAAFWKEAQRLIQRIYKLNHVKG